MSGETEMSPGARVRKSRAVPLIIATAMFMEQLDGTVLATALPSMARSFGIDPLHMSVALTSYLVSLAVLIPASGALADRLGSRTVFATAIALFTLGSILCAVSPNLPFLVVARLVQGAGGAMMVPVGRLVLLQTTAKSELVAAMNWLLIPATLGPLMGPPVGGFLVTTLNWRFIFIINVPMGIVGFVLAVRLIPQLRSTVKRHFDGRGMITSGVALTPLIFGLELASRGVLQAWGVAAAVALAVVSSALYVRHARRTRNPILDLRLLRLRTFRVSMIAGAATRIPTGAMPFLLPLLLQVGIGMSAARAGLVTFVTALGSLAVRSLSRRAIRQFGYRRIMMWNGVGAALFSFACATFRPDTSVVLMDAVLFAGGFSQSLQFTSYNTLAYAEVPTKRMSAATSFYATMQQVMLTLGICVAAGSLAVSIAVRGVGRAGLTDFSVAFAVVGAVGLIAPLVSSRLAPDAGSELSGHESGGRLGASCAARLRRDAADPR